MRALNSNENWREVASRVRNWGKWGKDDQIGTLNYLGPDKIIGALACVRTGVVYSLQIPIDASGFGTAGGPRRNALHVMSLLGRDVNSLRAAAEWPVSSSEVAVPGPSRVNDDYVVMPLQCGTQLDGLAHVFYDDELYNGFPATAVDSSGARADGIEHIAKVGGLVGRGVLIDLARSVGCESLAPHAVIGPKDLDDALVRQRTSLQEGDILLIRTGWLGNWLRTKDNAEYASESAPGLSWHCAEWFASRRVSAVACDNIAVETRIPEIVGVPNLLHMIALRDMGLTLGECWNLEHISVDCESDGLYDFLLVAAPLRVTGAVGSPVNPIAIR